MIIHLNWTVFLWPTEWKPLIISWCCYKPRQWNKNRYESERFEYLTVWTMTVACRNRGSICTGKETESAIRYSNEDRVPKRRNWSSIVRPKRRHVAVHRNCSTGRRIDAVMRRSFEDRVRTEVSCIQAEPRLRHVTNVPIPTAGLSITSRFASQLFF